MICKKSPTGIVSGRLVFGGSIPGEELFVQKGVPGVARVDAGCMFGKLDKGDAIVFVDSCT